MCFFFWVGLVWSGVVCFDFDLEFGEGVKTCKSHL